MARGLFLCLDIPPGRMVRGVIVCVVVVWYVVVVYRYRPINVTVTLLNRG